MKSLIAGLLAGTALCLGASQVVAGEAPDAAVSGFPREAAAPKGAPNVLIVMTDDVGFASSSVFGGAIPTPTFDRLAQDGLKYVNFHTTALCSPSRAALLTGRNHHAVGFGTVADLATAQEGYNSIIPKSAGTIAQILARAGYSTAMIGKHHNAPTWQSGPAGPFDQWPSGLGFQYFYGFNGGHTNQFVPALIENNSSVEAPSEPDYILDRDLSNRAIDWLRMQRTQSGGKPFLLYLAPGTAHTPLHAPKEWLARFKGKFDAGWDVYRRDTFARQVRLGIVPRKTALPPPPPGVPAWDSLSSDQQRLYARYMEAYAAALAYSDDQIGRVIAQLRQSGQLDNTLVVFVQGDNGAEGSGAFNYNAMANWTANSEEFGQALAHIDDIGGPRSYPGVPLGWARAMNTPFPYQKTVASRLGGITNGMVVSWPAGIRQRGVRHQFTDLTDVLPTVLEVAGLPRPETIDGVGQAPFDGTSFAYTFAGPEVAERPRVKYFEMMGNAALYKDGWFAASRVQPDGRADRTGPWQLYDLRADPAQAVDLAGQNPAKLAELQAVFAEEARRNHVLPRQSAIVNPLLPQNRPEITAAAGRHLLYPSAFRYAEGTFPSINNRSWTITADIEVAEGGGEGVVVTQGGQFSGWGLVMLKGVPTFIYRSDNWEKSVFRLAAPKALAAGRHKLSVAFTSTGGMAAGGSYELRIDGKSVAQGTMDKTVGYKFSPEDATIGFDSGTPLTDDYRVPFPFRGRIEVVEFDLQPASLRKP